MTSAWSRLRTSSPPWAPAAIIGYGALAFLALGVVAVTHTRTAWAGDCGPRLSVALGVETSSLEGKGTLAEDECQSAAEGELVVAGVLVLAPAVLAASAVALVRHSSRVAEQERAAIGPPPPSVPPSHLHWDGHRWLRWDGSAWVPDSDQGGF